MIIVEGTDCTGKTTLCKALAEKLPRHTYQHLSKPGPRFDFLWDYIHLYNPQAIFDRFYLSELVYTEVRGEAPRIADWQQTALADFVAKNCFTVLLTSDDDELRRLYGDKEEMYALDKVLFANELFEALDLDQRGDLHITNLTKQGPQEYHDTVNFIVKEYRMMRSDQIRSNLF